MWAAPLETGNDLVDVGRDSLGMEASLGDVACAVEQRAQLTDGERGGVDRAPAGVGVDMDEQAEALQQSDVVTAEPLVEPVQEAGCPSSSSPRSSRARIEPATDVR